MELYSENQKRNGGATLESMDKKLITEHALLAAQFAGNDKSEVAVSILARLKEIEQELALSPNEIARLALQSYKNQYK
jgi:hypothetical protein